MRIISYNIRGGLGMDGRRDTARIARVVADQNPDVVCFQEVHQRLPWSGWIDQPRRLRQALRMPFVFQANVHYGFGGYGVGTATRFPVRHVRRHRLPSRGERRGALEVTLATPDGPLTVFCTHWGLRDAERECQAQALSGIIREAAGEVIVCGDLNEAPEVAAIRSLLEQTGLRDWGAVTGAPTYPADTPSVRIDVIFGSEGLSPGRCSVIETGASDHRPLVADFRWTTHD